MADKDEHRPGKEDARQQGRTARPSVGFPAGRSADEMAAEMARLRAQFEQEAAEASATAGAAITPAMPEYFAIKAAYLGDINLLWAAEAMEADLATSETDTGLAPVHIAAGSDNMRMLRYLIEEKQVPLGPDRFGRWPSIVAAECGASTEVVVYLAEAEAKDEPKPSAQA